MLKIQYFNIVPLRKHVNENILEVNISTMKIILNIFLSVLGPKFLSWLLLK